MTSKSFLNSLSFELGCAGDSTTMLEPGIPVDGARRLLRFALYGYDESTQPFQRRDIEEYFMGVASVELNTHLLNPHPLGGVVLAVICSDQIQSDRYFTGDSMTRSGVIRWALHNSTPP